MLAKQVGHGDKSKTSCTSVISSLGPPKRVVYGCPSVPKHHIRFGPAEFWAASCQCPHQWMRIFFPMRETSSYQHKKGLWSHPLACKRERVIPWKDGSCCHSFCPVYASFLMSWRKLEETYACFGFFMSLLWSPRIRYDMFPDPGYSWSWDPLYGAHAIQYYTILYNYYIIYLEDG